MNDVKDLSLQFKADMCDYARSRNRVNFHLVEEFDEYEDERLFLHNDDELSQDKEFRAFAIDLIVKHFIVNQIYNVYFAYSLRLADRVGVAS